MIWFFGRFNCEDLHLLSAISTEWPRGWQNFHIANHCASFRHKNPARKAAPCRSWEVSQGAPGEGMGWRPCETLLGRRALRLKNLNEWLTCAARLLE